MPTKARQKTKLRIAALVRVSTEKQDKQGESLRTQKTQIENAAKSLDAEIVKWYGGQEHATAGWEHGQVQQLIDDAQKKPRPFDAVMVTDPDRWSRDNTQSETGLNALRDAGVRLFQLTSEHNLFDPTVKMSWALFAVIGSFHAGSQRKKSIENRIHRAKRGCPTCGRLPYGRTFDRETGKWGVDPEKRKIIEDIAERYLAGEAMPQLAKEYDMNHSALHKTLMHRCGDEWVQTFADAEFDIDETVTVKVPALLPKATIAALQKKCEANKTYSHKGIRTDYLLRRVVFCAHCGYAMFGQENSHGRRYYRHAHGKRDRTCPRPLSHIPAEELEDAVILTLFNEFGNPAVLQRAIERAVPDLGKIEKYRERIMRIDSDLNAIDKGRQRIIDLVGRDAIGDDEAEAKLDELRDRKAGLQRDRERLAQAVGNVPDAKAIEQKAKQVALAARIRIRAHASTANHTFGEMSFEDKRSLIETVFGGMAPDGQRLGVYVEWLDGEENKHHKRYRFTIRGHLIEHEGVFPFTATKKKAMIEEPMGGSIETGLGRRTKCASH